MSVVQVSAPCVELVVVKPLTTTVYLGIFFVNDGSEARKMRN